MGNQVMGLSSVADGMRTVNKLRFQHRQHRPGCMCGSAQEPERFYRFTV
jgi:hypothetical protein